MAGSVDCDDLDVLRLDGGSEGQAADAAEAVNADFNHLHILQLNNLQKKNICKSPVIWLAALFSV